MGYPYGDTYLEQIRKNPDECKAIKDAFNVLRVKYMKDHGYSDTVDLSIEENFKVLGEAFEFASETVGDIADVHHFMWDVVDTLLGGDFEYKGERV